SAKVVAALSRRGQIVITLTNGTKVVTVRISAERTTSSRLTMTVRQLSTVAVTINPKVLTCGPPPVDCNATSLTATWCINLSVSWLKSGDQAVARSAEYPAKYLTAASPV